MKETVYTCDGCEENIPNTRESDYYTLLHKRHYMIPNYDSERHFCSMACLKSMIVRREQ